MSNRPWTLTAAGKAVSNHVSLRAAIRAGIRFEQPEAVSDYTNLEVWDGDKLVGDPNELWAESGGTRGMFA